MTSNLKHLVPKGTGLRRLPKIVCSIFKIFLVALLLAAQVHFAYAQSAALLPVAPQQFFDKNGNPVSSGSVGYYIPGTSTPKMVWQDDSQTTPWSNPITLNAGGWPPNNKGIYGNGTYRQIIKDKNNNIISDQPTSATGSGGGSGSSVGDGNSVGTILAWSGMVAPNQYQFAYGQSLSRTTFPELYQAVTLLTPVTCVGGNTTLTGISDTSNIPVGAALEGNCIVAGSTVISKTINTVTLSIAANISTTANIRFFPYGNGNGTTTFNAPDLRGKVIPGRTNMGGVTASNLTNTYYGSSPDAVGANGGTQSSTLAQSNLPDVNFNVSIPSGQGAHTHSYTLTSGANQTLQPGGANIATVSNSASNTGSSTLPAMTGTAPSGGSGTAFSLVQPSITLNYIIKVTPDTSISGLFGVASIGGMQGIIACGSGITCAGNIISVVLPPSGDVFGPASSVVGQVATFADTSGKLLNNTTATLHAPAPANLYVNSTSGTDSNDCLTVGTSCFTIQRAINVARTFDYTSAAILKINLAASATPYLGFMLSGTPTGWTRGNSIPPRIEVVGAGSATTTIDPAANCGASNNQGAFITNLARVGFGSVTMKNSCVSAGSNIYIDNDAIGYFVDNDVVLDNAGFALLAVHNASFQAGFVGSRIFNIKGNAQYGIWISTVGKVITGATVTNKIIGNPSFSAAFLSLGILSTYNQGIGSVWDFPANATGIRYQAYGNSYIDTEQSTQNLPGSLTGRLQDGSRYYDNRNIACIGNGTTCVDAAGNFPASPTGAGTGASFLLRNGSGDHSGAIAITIGTGASAAGTLTVVPSSRIIGDWGGSGFCVTSLNHNATAWSPGANVQNYYDASIGVLTIRWDNNGVTPVGGTVRYINYLCQ